MFGKGIHGTMRDPVNRGTSGPPKLKSQGESLKYTYLKRPERVLHCIGVTDFLPTTGFEALYSHSFSPQGTGGSVSVKGGTGMPVELNESFHTTGHQVATFNAWGRMDGSFRLQKCDTFNSILGRIFVRVLAPVESTPSNAGLEDTKFIEDLAANYDIIVNTGSGFIASGAIAFVNGLARRVKAGKPTPWMLHVSGCTNLADRPLTQPPKPLREWNDEEDATEILEFMKALDKEEPYDQRTAELGVLEAAAASGVQAVSVNTPVIFGEGTGLFNQQGLVIPLILMYVVQHGYGWTLNETANFDWVHILDLADLFVLLVRTILEREDRGVGYIKTGVMFAAVGRTLIKDINQRCLDVAFTDGVLPRDDTPKEKEIRLVSLEEIADKLTAGRLDVAERGWGGHKATKGA
ncbi:hypothetical protein CC80DRAFT_598980 [Byssothecium circinans]|uniref:NAD-dependent epimerase/dehydratase domain-containing protein n=1 Tax=Byssothecium circinans TaxID=147558 RepID=A0A6A5TCK0_9PLEO|nr:hypothetical protein CC80DRAFT_598980 [Byssothecium circinans]